MYYVNENVKNLDRIFDQNSREEFLRLDLNENPGGLPEDFVKDVLNSVTPQFVAQYPETLEFTQCLGKKIGAKVSEICLTNGSAEAIRYIIEAYSRPNGEILSVTPSYAMYGVYSKMYGRKHRTVTYNENLEFDVNKLIDEITPDLDIVIVLNPNNPMGDVYSYDDMDKIIAAAKKNEVTVLIDEAYYYFYPNSFIEYALENDNVFLTRTFSKLFSLAGCRLGYVVGKEEGIKNIQKLCTPHNVNAFAMKFAQAILEKEGMIEEMVDIQIQGKKYLVDTLEEYGYKLNAKEGNFIFIEVKSNPDELVRRMKTEKNILIKVYRGIGNMKNCIRVTTGEKDIMEKFIHALIELDK